MGKTKSAAAPVVERVEWDGDGDPLWSVLFAAAVAGSDFEARVQAVDEAAALELAQQQLERILNPPPPGQPQPTPGEVAAGIAEQVTTKLDELPPDATVADVIGALRDALAPYRPAPAA